MTLVRQGSAFCIYFMDHAPADWHDPVDSGTVAARVGGDEVARADDVVAEQGHRDDSTDRTQFAS